MAARLVGAGPIIAVDILPQRLALALELGASHAIDNRSGDLAGGIAAITGRGVDFVVETTGSPQMQRLAVEALHPGGAVALLTGETGRDDLPEGRRTIGIIQGDAVPQHFIPRLIELYRSGSFPLEGLVRFYDFTDINRAIADSRNGTIVKPVLRIGG